MTGVARLKSVILALAISAIAAISLPALGAPAASSAPPSLTLKDAPVQEVLRLLAKAQGVDLLMTDDVQGTISLEVSQKTPEEILDLIAGSKNLYWWKESGVYVVSGHPRGASTKAAAPPAEAAPSAKPLRADRGYTVVPLQYYKAQDLAYLFGGAPEPYTKSLVDMGKVMYPYGQPGQAVGVPAGQRVGQTSGVRGATNGSQPSGRTTAAFSENPYKELAQVGVPGVINPGEAAPGAIPGQEGVTGALSGAGAPLAHLLPEGLSYPVAFAPLNALLVQGSQEAIEEFRKLVELLDVRVPQIEVEAQFVEMSAADARQFGIDWSWLGSETNIDVVGLTAGGNVGISFVKGRFSALLQTLLTEDRGRVINAPRLTTMNNQASTFTQSQTYYYFTSSSIVQPPGFAGSQVITTNTLNALPVVTSFTILPQVNGDNSITVDLTVTVSDVIGFVTGPNGERIPQPTATSLPSRLRVENGETIVMGGFVRKNVSTSRRKIPLLSDIPILGKLLFTGTTYTYSDSELLIFMTARIMEEKGGPPIEAGGTRMPFSIMPLGAGGGFTGTP